MAYTFDAPEAPSTKGAQYYEMFGHRAIISDGWKAVTRHTKGVPFDDDVWELYHLDQDRSECHDLAATHPDKLTELVDRWWVEAEDQGVLPLDDRSIELFFTRFRDNSPHPVSRHYEYFPPIAPMPSQVSPGLGGRGFDMVASIDRTRGQGGVLFATGTENSGISFFVQDDRLVLDYNSFNDHTVLVSDADVPAGHSDVAVEFRRVGAGATARLLIDGAPSGEAEVPFAMHIISSVGPSVGYDHGSPVSGRYSGHFPFEGTLHKVTVDVVRKAPSDDDAAARRARRHVPAVGTGEAATPQAVNRADAPALTSMTAPVMWRAPSEHRKTTAEVISSASNHGTGWTCSVVMTSATSSRVGCSRSDRIRL